MSTSPVSERHDATRTWRGAVTSGFVYRVGETFVVRVLLAASGLPVSVLIARQLGPAGRGVYAMGIAITGLGIQLTNLGLQSANTYHVARDRSLLPVLVANSASIIVAIASTCLSIAGLVLWVRPHWVAVDPVTVAVALAFIPIGVAYLLLQGLLLGVQDSAGYNRIELFTKLLGLGLVVALFGLLQPRATLVFAATQLPIVIGIVWGLYRLKIFSIRLRLTDSAILKSALAYGLRAQATCLFAFLLLRADLLMVQSLLGSEWTGQYSVAVSLADAVYLLPVAAGAILFSKLSAMGDAAEKWRQTKIVCGAVAVLMCGQILLAQLWAPRLISLVFGARFAPSAPAFLYLLPGIAALSIVSILSSYIGSERIPLWIPAVNCFAAVVNISLNVFLIPKYGIVGASLASTFAYTLLLVGTGTVAYRLRLSAGPTRRRWNL
jgi:O-antigen/teichoic acid export membrane protein